jgi:phytoene desaturase
MIHELEQKFGVWFAMGGTGALVKGFGDVFLDIGGEVFLDAEVDEIQIDEKTGKATGVRTKAGEVLVCDAVVSNADVGYTYLNLVPSRFRRKNTNRKIESMDFSMSLFVIYFGTDRKYDNIAHHEIILGNRYRGLLEDIFERKILADDFSLYLHRPTATDTSLAPEGCDSWYVLSPVPNLEADIDWTTKADEYKQLIYKYLEENYLPDLRKHIVTDHYIDPRHFESTLNSFRGAAFSVEPTLLQSAWLRPHNVSEDISNLYFVGAGTHPGAGLPGVISSGRIVGDLIGRATKTG